MFDLLINFWYLWVIVILIALYRLFKPAIKGWFGEKTVALCLKTLPQEEYILINDIILPAKNGTTQIDHIVVSIYGVFVIETKNYVGWIFGSEKSAQWTQNIYGKKTKFMNPLFQNFAHTEAIKAKLNNYPNLPIIPIIAFSPSCDLKVKTESHVVYFHRVAGVIKKYKEKVISIGEASNIAQLLTSADMSSHEVKKEHIKSVAAKKEAVENAEVGGICPKCGGQLLERKGKNGVFIGCSNYPKCRFSKTTG
jgi:Zn-finger domain associated with topoisomerase type I